MDGNKVTATEEIQGIFPNIGSNTELTEEFYLAKETSCGFWFIKGRFLQKFANKKVYVLLYGLLGCFFSASYAYFNGTITTLEKRFKIPSKTTGVIAAGNDLSQLLVSAILSYYAGKGHRPRWMALGMYTVVLFCLISALPHFLYGAGDDFLSLTLEHSAHDQTKTYFKENASLRIERDLCQSKHRLTRNCRAEEGNVPPQLILFAAQFISGIGGSLYYTLGVAYMDDNIKRSKTPALLSLTYFIRMLGPAVGYALASICLKLYINPNLTPKIDNRDPRWLGAWWLGWLILSVVIFVLSTLLALFPKQLPRAAVRRELLKRQTSRQESKVSTTPRVEPASFKDMIKTFERVIRNRVLMMNNFAAVFYFLGYMPYWIFLPKYIETQYRQSASASSLITGSSGLVFPAAGVLLSGLVVTRYKPKARKLAAWNVVVGIISVSGIISYAYLGCPDLENNYKNVSLLSNGELNPTTKCNLGCHCNMKYSPVCSQDGKTTYISACHAGCRHLTDINGSTVFSDCTCIIGDKAAAAEGMTRIRIDEALQTEKASSRKDVISGGGSAHPGSCQVDCLTQFYIFISVVCLLKFSGATGRASNFLVTVRCVDEKDKSVAIGFGVMLMSLCAFVPSPIIFGVILDKACLLWGRTCSGSGNCWLYNGPTLRYTMNFTAATFVFIGTLFDVGVWYFVKDLKIFDEDVELELQDFNVK